MTTYKATKAFAIGTGGLVTSYAIGDVVQPAHAMIAPQFVGEDGAVRAVTVHDLSYEGGMHALAGTERDIPAQLVLIAKGFTGPEQAVLDAFAPYDNVFLAGDARMGSTLVATAIADGLDIARNIAHKAMRL